jgi:protein required for attachment to host cells
MLVLSRKQEESVTVGGLTGACENTWRFAGRAIAARRTVMGKTNVEVRNHAWFALADAEHCRLLCCRLTKQGTQHVDEYGACENTLPEQEHKRPMTGTGTTHYVEEEERRFAGEIVEWLRGKVEEHKIDHLVIFAPARILGAIRKAPPGLLKGHLEELKGNLMRLDAGQLAQHPMLRELVREAHERSSRGGSPATFRRVPKSKVGQRRRGEPVALVERKAWRAGSRDAGPASTPGSRGRHGATTGGHAGRTGRRRGEK